MGIWRPGSGCRTIGNGASIPPMRADATAGGDREARAAGRAPTLRAAESGINPAARVSFLRGCVVGHEAGTSRIARFDGLIMPHLTALYRAALRFTRTVPDAEDLVQETCLRALQNLDQLRQPEAAKAWVFAVLRSVYLRRAERWIASPIVSVADLDAAAIPRPDMRGEP